MVSRTVFLVSFLLAIASHLCLGSTRDADRDAIIAFHDTLSNLAHSLVDVHNEMNSGVPEAENDVGELQGAGTRMTFEVRVMRVEHDVEVLAGKRSGTDLVARGKKISDSETSLNTTLPEAIQNTTDHLTTLNSTMQSTTLNNSVLADLQTEANKNLTGDDQISIPQTGDIMANVTSEITLIRPIYQRRATADQYRVIDQQLTLIKGNFESMLTSSQAQNFQEVAEFSKSIDVSLSQIKQLNVMETQARMEL